MWEEPYLNAEFSVIRLGCGARRKSTLSAKWGTKERGGTLLEDGRQTSCCVAPARSKCHPSHHTDICLAGGIILLVEQDELKHGGF